LNRLALAPGTTPRSDVDAGSLKVQAHGSHRDRHSSKGEPRSLRICFPEDDPIILRTIQQDASEVEPWELLAHLSSRFETIERDSHSIANSTPINGNWTAKLLPDAERNLPAVIDQAECGEHEQKTKNLTPTSRLEKTHPDSVMPIKL